MRLSPRTTDQRPHVPDPNLRHRPRTAGPATCTTAGGPFDIGTINRAGTREGPPADTPRTRAGALEIDRLSDRLPIEHHLPVGWLERI